MDATYHDGYFSSRAESIPFGWTEVMIQLLDYHSLLVPLCSTKRGLSATTSPSISSDTLYVPGVKCSPLMGIRKDAEKPIHSYAERSSTSTFGTVNVPFPCNTSACCSISNMRRFICPDSTSVFIGISDTSKNISHGGVTSPGSKSILSKIPTNVYLLVARSCMICSANRKDKTDGLGTSGTMALGSMLSV